MNEFAKIMRKIRREKDITQEELAEMLNYKKSTICNWERGKRMPRVDDLKRLSVIFNVTVDYLVGKSEEKKGRLVTVEELKTFIPEDVVRKHKLEILVDEMELSADTKLEIIQTLKREGYM